MVHWDKSSLKQGLLELLHFSLDEVPSGKSCGEGPASHSGSNDI